MKQKIVGAAEVGSRLAQASVVAVLTLGVAYVGVSAVAAAEAPHRPC